MVSKRGIPLRAFLIYLIGGTILDVVTGAPLIWFIFSRTVCLRLSKNDLVFAFSKEDPTINEILKINL